MQSCGAQGLSTVWFGLSEGKIQPSFLPLAELDVATTVDFDHVGEDRASTTSLDNTAKALRATAPDCGRQRGFRWAREGRLTA